MNLQLPCELLEHRNASVPSRLATSTDDQAIGTPSARSHNKKPLCTSWQRRDVHTSTHTHTHRHTHTIHTRTHQGTVVRYIETEPTAVSGCLLRVLWVRTLRCWWRCKEDTNNKDLCGNGAVTKAARTSHAASARRQRLQMMNDPLTTATNDSPPPPPPLAALRQKTTADPSAFTTSDTTSTEGSRAWPLSPLPLLVAPWPEAFLPLSVYHRSPGPTSLKPDHVPS
jgi:hypothetical protein